ncbi:hypothetical protein [Streptomyces sp. NPDC001436]
MSRSPLRRGRVFAVMPVALAIAATTALGTTAYAAIQQAPGGSATLVTDITYQISDHEDFGPNEHCTRTDHSEETVRPIPQSFAFSRTCGGEIRVEIDYRARYNSDGYSITIMEGHVKFFEGSSVFTNDQDGGLVFGFTGEPQTIIPVGSTKTRSFYVENNDEGQPEDHAIVTVTWKNIKNNTLGRIGHP